MVLQGQCAEIRAILLAVTHTKVHLKEALKLLCLISMLSQVTLPGEGQSFAWMYSIEDPAGDSKFRGCGAQVSKCASVLVLDLLLLLQFCHACAEKRHGQTL